MSVLSSFIPASPRVNYKQYRLILPHVVCRHRAASLSCQQWPAPAAVAVLGGGDGVQQCSVVQGCREEDDSQVLTKYVTT